MIRVLMTRREYLAVGHRGPAPTPVLFAARPALVEGGQQRGFPARRRFVERLETLELELPSAFVNVRGHTRRAARTTRLLRAVERRQARSAGLKRWQRAYPSCDPRAGAHRAECPSSRCPRAVLPLAERRRLLLGLFDGSLSVQLVVAQAGMSSGEVAQADVGGGVLLLVGIVAVLTFSTFKSMRAQSTAIQELQWQGSSMRFVTGMDCGSGNVLVIEVGELEMNDIAVNLAEGK